MSTIIGRLPRELRGIGRAARDAGWLIEPTRNGHWKWIAPTGKTIYTSSTPSDGRAFKNIRAQLKREGLDCEHL